MAKKSRSSTSSRAKKKGARPLSTLPSSSSSSKYLLSPNWSGFDVDLLGLILDKLVLLSDYIRFSAVCKSWNSVALFYKENRISQSKHQPPWVLMWHSSSNNKSISISFSLYNFITAEICKIKLHIPDTNTASSNLCVLSLTHGWLLAYYHKTNNSNYSTVMMVLNPLSGQKIHLPQFKDQVYIDSATLSRDPSLGSFELVASCHEYYAYLKFGDEFWTYSKRLNNNDTFYSVAFFKQGRLLGVTLKGIFVTIDIISEDIDNGDSSRYLKVSQIAPTLEVPLCHLVGYFVKAINGDLLLVYRYLYHDSLNTKTYKIYKLIDSNGKLEHIPVETLGGQCLFLKENQCGISILATNYSGYKPNAIYCNGFCKALIEVFNLEDGSITPNCFPALENATHFFGWIVPTMKL